jgi:hypothetical protein
MQGSKKPPGNALVETTGAPLRGERTPSSVVAPRRDARAEPDDDMSTSRVDVVNVGGGAGSGGESAASGLVSLRRELAKLHQQAAAVEKSLEEQRRDRTEALDRSERATERAFELEARVASLENEAGSLHAMREASLAELQRVRTERDDLALAVEAAKAATADVGKLEEEIAHLRSSAEDSVRASAELARARAELDAARRAAEIAEQDALLVGGQATRVREEATTIRAEADGLRAELAVAKDDATRSREDAETARTDATRALEEASKARDEAAKARDEAAKARDEAAKARDEAAKARDEAAKARDEAAKARDEAATAAHEDAAKLREALATSRSEVTALEAESGKARAELARAKEDNTRDRATARDRIDVIERALDDARTENLRVERDLETARATEESLTRDLETARAAEERLTRDLETARATVTQSEQRAATTEASHAALEQSVRRLREEIAGAFARVQPATLPPAQRSRRVSIPPEQPPAVVPDTLPVSIPTPTYASVPPQIHRSSAPPPSGAAARGSARKTEPPPAAIAALAAAFGSTPPPSGPPSDSMPPDHAWNDSSPPTRRPGASAVPPPMDSDLSSKLRLDLLAQLAVEDGMEDAAVALRDHPEWLRSIPPPSLVTALSNIDYDAEGAVFDLARAWAREPLCHALIAALRAESDPRLREHLAWLLKHLAAPSSWKAIADLASGDEEPPQLRRWLLEALERLAAGRAIGWRELGALVTTVARSTDPSLRDGAVAILVALERSEEKRRLLLDILRVDDDETVLASAVNALASVLPMDLDQQLVNRLLGHPSVRVQASVRNLVERVRLTKP